MKQGWIQVNSNNTQEPLAPKTLADMVYMDESQSQTVRDSILWHTPVHMTAALPAGSWSQTVPYTQTVQVAGLLATDIPLVDVVLSNDTTTAIAQLQDYALIGRIDAADGQLKAYCYRDKPTVALTVLLKVVR